MKVTLNGVDVSDWADITKFDPNNSDLGNPIDTAKFMIAEVDGIAVPRVPARGQDALIYEDDGVHLIFGGRVSELDLAHDAGNFRAWTVKCQGHAVRTLELQTGTVDYTGVADYDRNIVIAILRSAMKARAFGPSSGLVDDPIITANEPSWPGVKATAYISGLDFSSKTVKAALDLLTASVAGVSWKIGPDKIVSYGLNRDPAPAPLHTSPRTGTTAAGTGSPAFQPNAFQQNAFQTAVPSTTTAALSAMGDYHEETIVGDHRNMQRYTGSGASATAYDEVSYARLGGRVLEGTPIVNAKAPASMVQQLAFAALVPIKRVAHARTIVAGYRAGQLVDVCEETLGSEALPAPFPETLTLYARSDSAALAGGSRGRWVVQKVTRKPGAPISSGQASVAEYQLELGSNVRDLGTGLAVLAGLGR